MLTLQLLPSATVRLFHEGNSEAITRVTFFTLSCETLSDTRPGYHPSWGTSLKVSTFTFRFAISLLYRFDELLSRTDEELEKNLKSRDVLEYTVFFAINGTTLFTIHVLTANTTVSRSPPSPPPISLVGFLDLILALSRYTWLQSITHAHC